MIPIPSKDLLLNDWIESLDSCQILLLLDLWKGKTYFEDIPELTEYLKTIFKKSYTIKQHYDIAIKKANEKDIFDNDIIDFEPPAKRYCYTSNCGRSQCEMRFNGCNHSP